MIEKLSQISLSLINVKSKQGLSAGQHKFALNILKNYDHLFEIFALDKLNTYCQKDGKLKETDEVDMHLIELDEGVYDLVTIIKQLKKLMQK